jgi:hypothetical protein
MTPRHRLTRTLLLAVFAAAAVGRAELGADTEASVIFTPAFAAAAPVAAVAGWFAAGAFGQAAWQGWLRAGGAFLMVLVVTGIIGAMAAPLLGGIPAGPFGLLTEILRHPLSLGAALVGLAAVQVIALRQGRAGTDQSRK